MESQLSFVVLLSDDFVNRRSDCHAQKNPMAILMGALARVVASVFPFSPLGGMIGDGVATPHLRS
jgi:hypothetical protein